jgi:two-component system sensor histidine kinase PilS (NtrC family)
MTAMDRLSSLAGLSRAESQAAVEAENWKLLQYFNYYRLAIALLASGISFALTKFPPLGEARPELFQSTGFTYAVLALIGVFTIRGRKPDFDTHATLLSFADITLLTMLMHASGGLSSGLGLLLAVAIGGASLMLSWRLTIFYASLAAIAAILEHSWGLLTGGNVVESEVLQNFPQVGFFGVGLYATALLGHSLAMRLRATEALAERRGVDLANLAQLNELIIQRMQAGVVVCDAAGTIRQMNIAAQKYLGVAASGTKPSLSDAAPDLAIQLFQWIGNAPDLRTRKMFRSRAGYTLLPRFVTLGEVVAPPAATKTVADNSTPAKAKSSNGAVLIFLDDMAILKQQAQQLKMSALARLTASIAHEIRNPLGAISNAAQLLGESGSQDGEEKRLVKIIDEQSRRMNVIVQNVTQLSRRDRVSPVRLALDPWLAEFTRQYSETVFIPRETFTRIGGEGITVCADPDQLYQVVSNLCQNALRHSPPFSGTPLIKLQAGLDGDHRPILDVIDWGAGVPPENVDNIFDPFFTTTPKGTGLGLYIARELCEGNGGSLDYHPGEGGVGSRFRVTFARAEECAEMGPL